MCLRVFLFEVLSIEVFFKLSNTYFRNVFLKALHSNSLFDSIFKELLALKVNLKEN